MAIIIPSKRIYEIDNPKVLENALKSIDIQQKVNKTVITNENTERISQNLDKIAGTSETTVVETYDISKNPPENKLYGTWTFNSTVSLPTSEIYEEVSFVCQGIKYKAIKILPTLIAYERGTQESTTLAYSDGYWYDESLRNVTFDEFQETSAELWSVFNSNAIWQFQLMVGGKIETKVFTPAENLTLRRRREGYYVTDIAPTINAKFDVKVTEIGVESIWAPDNPHFLFYDDKEIRSRETTALDYTYDTENANYNSRTNLTTKTSLSILPERVFADFSVTSGDNLIQSAKWTKVLSMINPYYPYEVEIVNENTDSFELKIRLVSKITVWVAQGYLFSAELGNFGSPFAPNAIKIELTYKSSEIVYNESVRRLETSEETVSLVSKTAQGEATYSIDANQFIRAENKYNGVQGAASILYGKTLADYQKGVETASLRCSIGEYYDENDNKVISAESSTKMLFDEYDEVVPMYNNGKGIDEPISYNSEGLAKTFEVVGVRLFYDGAVWQELTLREKGAIAVNLPLPAPRITIRGSIATINEQSGLATEFGVYVNGRQMAIVNKGDTLDLASLGLASGKYTITADSRTSSVGYRTSPKSRGIVYEVKPRLEYYTEVNESGGLTYHITAEDYKIIGGTYVIGD